MPTSRSDRGGQWLDRLTPRFYAFFVNITQGQGPQTQGRKQHCLLSVPEAVIYISPGGGLQVLRFYGNFAKFNH